MQICNIDSINDNYDKYDIIDYLEIEYIDNWLKLIPDNIWIKYSKDIIKIFYKITNEKLIDFIINKIKINMPLYVVKNMNTISLEILKYCEKNYLTQLLSKLKKKNYIVLCLMNKNLDFNKYFFENLYYKINPIYEYKGINNENNFILLDNNEYIHKDNEFLTTIKRYKSYYSNKITNYDIIKYYDKKIPNIFMEYKIENTMLVNKHKIFRNIFMNCKIINYNDTIELKRILDITNNEFINMFMISSSGYYILGKICMSGNIDFIFKILNKFWTNKLLEESSIINIITFSAYSQNINVVKQLYNFLSKEKNYIFNEEIYSKIVRRLLFHNKKNIYNEIIYEFINLGCKVIKNNSHFNKYSKSIKIYK